MTMRSAGEKREAETASEAAASRGESIWTAFLVLIGAGIGAIAGAVLYATTFFESVECNGAGSCENWDTGGVLIALGSCVGAGVVALMRAALRARGSGSS